eukprot:2443495-Rhodomonas_salina.2
MHRVSTSRGIVREFLHHGTESVPDCTSQSVPAALLYVGSCAIAQSPRSLPRAPRHLILILVARTTGKSQYQHTPLVPERQPQRSTAD